MNQQFRHRQFPAGNPLANALVVIAGILVISLSLALGFFVFITIAGFVLVMATVMGVRNWWLRQRYGRRPLHGRSGEQSAAPHQRRIIEGEYREVRRDDDQRIP